MLLALLLPLLVVSPGATPSDLQDGVTQGASSKASAPQGSAARRPNVLLLIADDLTATAMSCYGSEVCQTPNLDALAEEGLRFTRAYCQGTYCGPSRASFLSGYYPHALKMLGYRWPKERVGDRATWPRHFKDAGWHTARVGKVFHMGVPGDIEKGADGADDPDSWSERHNCAGPEWRAPGRGQTLEGNPDRTRPVVGGNTFVAVEAEGDDLVHADGRAAAKACELLERFAQEERPFFLAVGFVRPHVPFVAPAADFAPYPWEAMPLPPKLPGDQDDIPPRGINYKTSQNMQMDLEQQRRAVSAYFASVAYMDRQAGKVLDRLEQLDLADDTIVVFTSDHGYHLGEHDFWAKVSLLEESARVPLLLRVPGRGEGSTSASLVELLDLFPTVARLAGLPVPERLQGEDLTSLLDDATSSVRDAAFSANGKGFLLRTDRWAYIQYGEQAQQGRQLYDMHADPAQLTNLAEDPAHAEVVASFTERMAAKLAAVRASDLGS